MVTAPRQFQILAKYSALTSGARLRQLINTSRLMTATLGVALVGYLVIGFLLFHHGLVFIQRLPAVGTILGERILYLIFFFVFLMLVLSNAVVQYGSLFRSSETDWLLTLPIDHRVLFLWKIIESLVISSWGFMFISAPLLAAYGTLNHVSWTFYLRAFLLMIPFVAVPANLAAWLLLLLVRYSRRSWLPAIGILLAAGAAWYVYRHFFAERQLREMETNIVFALNQALHHTRISIHPLVPSTWWTDALVEWVKNLDARANFNAMLLTSNALMAMLLTYAGAGRFFTRAWNLSSRKHANAVSRRLNRARNRAAKNGVRPPPRFPWTSRVSRALVTKDLRGFIRDPAQWTQVAVVFGLLLIYVLNIRNMGYDLDSPFWTTVLTFLNIAVCALALSTLTTRFVFPQFSIEGQRLWILGMAPFPLTRVLWQKLLLNVTLTGSFTAVLMFVSGFMLKLPAPRLIFFVAMIALLSFGLNAIAISLGALFPNLRETNSARIVSGFGGTLCLIISFLYIVVSLALLIFTSIAFGLTKTSAAAATTPQAGLLPWAIALAGAIVVTVLFGCTPFFIALKRVKSLELLGNL